MSDMICLHCGRPIWAGASTWVGDASYHYECTPPSSSVKFPSSTPSQRIPSFDEQLGVDPTSKLAAAIDRLAAALEKYNSRNAPLPYPSSDDPKWNPK